MKDRNLTVLTDCVLITCIVQKGIAETVVKAARQAGAQGATIFYAKGTGVRERLGLLGVAVEVEKEIINVVVSSEQVDFVFDKMFLAGKLDTPGMGFMYCSRLEKAATYIPANIIEELNNGSNRGSTSSAA